MQQFKNLVSILFLLFSFTAHGAGTFIKGPALIEGFTVTTSAAGTTTLTSASETKQILTGSSTQTFVLPNATTLPLGRMFYVINKSTGTATVNANGGSLVATVLPGQQKEFHLRAAGSAAGTWDATRILVDLSNDVTGTLGISAGGTGASSFTANNVLLGNGTSAFQTVAPGASGNVLTSNGTTWQSTAASSGFSNPMTTSGDIIYGGASGVATRLAKGSNGDHLVLASGVPAWQTPTLPTIQRFTSGSGTYTTPTNVKWIKVRMIGGGGGGSGSGTSAGAAAGDGSATTFGNLSAGGGVKGGWNNSTAAGGSITVGAGWTNVASTAGNGSVGFAQVSTGVNLFPGGAGGVGALGGAAAANSYGQAGAAGPANTGCGGQGGGGNAVAATDAGTGGGAGGFIEAIATSPSATYSYSVGAGGTAGGAGGSGLAGGAGGSGIIIVEEYY